jgi:cell division protein FtsI/penicillin-binding protein 2
LILAVFLIAAIGLLLGGRAAQLSLAGEERGLALEPQAEEDANPVATRGDVIGAGGRKLSVSLDSASVIATPYLVKQPGKTARRLAQLPGMGGSGEIEQKLARRDGQGNLRGYSVLARDVRPRVAQKVEEMRIESITVEPDGKRVYTNGDLASQTLGYLGGYGTPYGGIEESYDETLSSGENVRLTLDAAVQQKLQVELGKARKKYKAKRARGLVMRVDDGAVVAAANVPGYDNNNSPEVSAELQRNRVITDAYEPGSTFKAFTMVAALEEGSLRKDESFTVPYSIPLAGHTIHDSLYHETKVMTAAEILKNSSNVGTVKIARDLGGERLHDYLERFGLGQPTGLGLQGEASGYLPPYDKWSGVSIGNIPIGQGLSMTPLQLATGYAAIANGGTLVTPHVTPEEHSDSHRMISEKTSAIVRGMLEGVIEDSNGVQAPRIPGYSVAGKTGTSQKIDPETGTYGDDYVASFVGFAPADDPKYLTLIVVDEPQKSFWGAEVAAPAFREVTDFTLNYFNVPPNRPQNTSGDSGE